MTKRDELLKPDSCLNRASHDELIFVLRGRDSAAPAAIRAWVRERIRSRKNERGDLKIIEAMECADRMAAERAALLERERIIKATAGGIQ